MSLHRHKVLGKPGFPEYSTTVLVGIAVAIMVVGPVLTPGTPWRQTIGNITSLHFYQHATRPDGKPHKVRMAYRYEAEGQAFTGEWDGEWPEAHSPNALPAHELKRLEHAGFPLHVMYDATEPGRSSLHTPPDRLSAGWLWLSVALAALVLCHLLVVYPRWKSLA